MQVEPQHGGDALDRTLEWATSVAKAGAVAAAILTVAATLGMMWFAAPTGDDFRRAGLQEPLLEHVRQVYLQWSGRWSGLGLEAVIVTHVDLVGAYPWLLVVPALLQMGGVLLLWRLLLGPRVWGRVGLSALLTVAVLWSGMPGIEQSIYWFIGAVENQLPLTLTIFCVGCLITLERLDLTRPGWLLVCTSGIVAVLITGIHELSALTLEILLGLGWIWSSRSRSPRQWAWATVFALTTIGLAVVVMAPGNFVRAAWIDRHLQQSGPPIVSSPVHRAIETLKVIASQQRNELPGWLLDARLLAASVWLLLAGRATGAAPNARVPHLLLVLVIWLGLVAVSIAAPTWALREFTPRRSLGTAYTVFVLGWMINLHLWSQGLTGGDDRRLRLMRLGAALLLMAGLLTQGTLRNVVREFRSGRALAYRAAVVDRDQRSRLAGRSQSPTDLVWEPLPRRPALLMATGLTTNPSVGDNIFIANYYRARSARLGVEGVHRLTMGHLDGPAAESGHTVTLKALEMDVVHRLLAELGQKDAEGHVMLGGCTVGFGNGSVSCLWKDGPATNRVVEEFALRLRKETECDLADMDGYRIIQPDELVGSNGDGARTLQAARSR
jgi:hypothetical protein